MSPPTTTDQGIVDAGTPGEPDAGSGVEPDMVATPDMNKTTPDQGEETPDMSPTERALRVGMSWHWQLDEEVDLDARVDLYDIDLFDTPPETIRALQQRGVVVICYFSAGTFEPYRPDVDRIAEQYRGASLEDWPDERWLDTRVEDVRAVMDARLRLAAEKGCDGVEPDNLDPYLVDSEFDLTEDDTINYVAFLAERAHGLGLLIGLKNAVETVPSLVDVVDFAVNESCLEYDECDTLDPFIEQEKPVLHAEYVDDTSQGDEKREEVCGQPSIQRFSTIIKQWDLDAWGLSCSDQ